MYRLMLVSIILFATVISSACQQQVQSDGTVTTSFKGTGVLYFWGTSCRACQMQDREIKTFRDKSSVPVKKIQPTQEMISKLNLTHYPTIIIFRNGKEIQRFKGVTYADQLLRATGYYDTAATKTTETTKTTTKQVGGSPR